MTAPHACRMPRMLWRWRRRVYVCDCGNLWTVKSRVVAWDSECPIVVRKWQAVA